MYFEKLPNEKKLPSDSNSGMVSIISVNLKSRSLLRKQIYADFEKEPEIPQNDVKLKLHDLNLYGEKPCVG